MNELNDIMEKYKNYYNGKTIWITGGGTGIGAALALKLSKLGAKVIISGRSENSLKEVSAKSTNIIPVVLNVAEDESWENAMKQMENISSDLDIMIFNAGICEYVDLPNFEADIFERVFAVNFFGIVKGLENVLPLLLKKNGSRVVAVTSSVAVLPLPRAEAYGASKAAATYLMDSLRLGLDKLGVGVTVVMPGFVETPLTDKNDFPMPFKISAENAADRIIRGIAKGKNHLFFPSRFTSPLRLLSLLGVNLQQFFTRRFSR